MSTASGIPTPANTVQALYPAHSTTQLVAFGAVAAAIANPVTASIVRILCTENAYIAFGDAPVADASDMLVVKNQPEYFRINPGEKVSVIQESAAGNMYVTEMD